MVSVPLTRHTGQLKSLQAVVNLVKLRGGIAYIDSELKRTAIVLNSGGWKTVTTKKWINKYLPNKFHLFQENFNWYIKNKDGTVISYKDNLIINY